MSDAAPSRLDDYLDVFVSPTQLFERRSDGKFGQALVVLIVLVAILFFATSSAMAPIMDAEIAKRMASRAQTMTPEQMEAASKMGGVFAGVGLVIFTPIAVLILGGVIFLVSRMVSGPIRFAQGATIATFAMFPRLIESIVLAVQALLMDEAALTSRAGISLGLARFLDPVATSPVVVALAGRMDLFVVWVTILIGIGLKVMGRISTGQAAAAAAIIWLLGAIPMVVGAMFQG